MQIQGAKTLTLELEAGVAAGPAMPEMGRGRTLPKAPTPSTRPSAVYSLVKSVRHPTSPTSSGCLAGVGAGACACSRVEAALQGTARLWHKCAALRLLTAVRGAAVCVGGAGPGRPVSMCNRILAIRAASSQRVLANRALAVNACNF